MNEAIRKHLRPELVNRLTKIVHFKPLGMETVREILGKLVGELKWGPALRRLRHEALFDVEIRNCAGKTLASAAGMCQLAGLMKIRAILFAIVAFAPLSLTLNAATLGEMAASAGLEWMIGKWASDDGQVVFSHSWKLDKHAVGVSFKMGERVGEGMILVKPGTDQVIYGGADNRGGMSTGKWITLNGNPTLISTHTDAEGNERKMAVEYVKTDDDTLTLKVHQVGEDGEPGSNVEHEAVFKRQK